jgi:hypothetical protein
MSERVVGMVERLAIVDVRVGDGELHGTRAYSDNMRRCMATCPDCHLFLSDDHH